MTLKIPAFLVVSAFCMGLFAPAGVCQSVADVSNPHFAQVPAIACKPEVEYFVLPPFNERIVGAAELVDSLTGGPGLQLGVRRLGTGSGFPLSAYGNPASTLGFRCYELGSTEVEVWVKDLDGATAQCTSRVVQLESGQHCDFLGTRYDIVARRWCDGLPVHPYTAGVLGDSVWYTLPILPPTFLQPFSSDTVGTALVEVGNHYDYRFVPEAGPAGPVGLSTADLLAMLDHIQGTAPFTHPIQWVAADADNDRLITVADVEALHAVLAGTADTLPGQQRRQFVSETFVFPPGDPLAAGIPDTFDLPEFMDMTLPYWVVETGDVDCGLPVNFGPDYPVTAVDRPLLAGETVAVAMIAGENDAWRGFQTTVQMHASATLLDVAPGDALPLDGPDWSQSPDSQVHFSWYSPNTHDVSAGDTLFTLVFQTAEAMQLRDAFTLSNVRLAPEVYPASGGIRPLTLVWSPAADTVAPVVTCPAQPINLNMPPTAVVALWVNDVSFGVTDNQTPDSLLVRALRRAGTGAGFPLNDQGAPANGVFFSCEDVFFNPHLVECWVRDADGNAAFCLQEVWVNDPLVLCDPSAFPFSACAVSACGNVPLEGVDYRLTEHGTGNPDVLDAVTGADGCYQSPLLQPGAVSDSVTLQARKNTDPLNGVSTFDLVLIFKHILGLETFDEPYQYLAADANNSNSVTTFDVAELRKLILGVYDSLPQNDSWRLYPAGYTFPSPNPLAGGVPNSQTVSVVPGAYQLAYKAVKVGDINCSALANNLADPTDRAFFPLRLPDQTLNAGESAVVPVFAGQAARWDGFQLALELHPGLTLETVSGGMYTPLAEENWHLTEKNVLNLSWSTGESVAISEGDPLFYLHVRAAQKIHPAEAFGLKKAPLKPEAYPAEGSVQTLEMHLSPGKSGKALLSPPQPNPTTGDATLRLQLPDDEVVNIQLYTTDGSIVYLRTIMFGKGANDVTLPPDAMPQPGLYLWRLQAGNDVWTGKLQRF